MEELTMEKKNIDWSNLGFGYIQTDKRFVSNYKDGAWDEGVLTEDATIVLNECAGVLQYAQTVFEGLKAGQTKAVITAAGVSQEFIITVREGAEGNGWL